MNAISDYISVHHALKLTLGGAVLCAAVAIETGLRGIFDIFELQAYKGLDIREKESIKHNISANLGSSLFYGLCAANLIPGTAMLGAGIFLSYSTCVTDSTKSLKQEYLLTKIIGQPCQWFAGKVIVPIFEQAIFPILITICEVTYNILASIPIPRHPIWVASAFMLTAIAVTKFALPLVGITLL